MTPSTLTRRPHEPTNPVPGDPRLPELMLYPGNLCNRNCGFCCVEGSPDGRYTPFAADTPGRVMELVLPDARLKVYGGEPTLHHHHLMELTAALRDRGYRGRLTVFSNGVQAHRLVEILEADPPAPGRRGSDAYLNHYVWHGVGADPIPASRRRHLEAWARANPGRLWLGHRDVLPVGGATDPSSLRALGADVPDFEGGCARCYPTLRSDGRLHACAFAVEYQAARYDLGPATQPPHALASRHRHFLAWVDEVLEPAARRLGESPCATCLRWARREASLATGRALPVVHVGGAGG